MKVLKYKYYKLRSKLTKDSKLRSYYKHQAKKVLYSK